MAKDINIHLKTTGAGETKKQIDEVGAAAQGLGQQTAAGQKQAGAAAETSSEKMNAFGGVIAKVKSQVLGFVAGWLGLQGVIKLVDSLSEKLKKIEELQRSIYEASLPLLEMGQRLEIQTGTIGKQQIWAKKIAEIQEIGAMQGPEVAQQMLVAMDIAFAKRGGIKSAEVMDIAKKLAPFVGAAGLGPQEVGKVFEFAGAAGIAPVAPAYKEYFAQLLAGYTASKATNFGEFMTGLQKGATAYMAMGGTLKEAISGFSAARAVVANEALAATLLEQIARISGGGYEKPRVAIETALGVKWPALGMDARTQALLEYARRLPPERRTEIMAEKGFPVELATGLTKFISPEATETIAKTRQELERTSAKTIEQIVNAYLESLVGEERKGQAREGAKVVTAGSAFAAGQRRLKESRKDFDRLVAEGKDKWWVPDDAEAYTYAMRDLLKEFENIKPFFGPDQAREIEQLQKDLESIIRQAEIAPAFLGQLGLIQKAYFQYAGTIEGLRRAARIKTIIPPSEAGAPPLQEKQQKPPPGPISFAEPAEPKPQEAEAPIRFAAVGQTVNNVSHYYDHSIKYYPRVGSDERGPRFTQFG